MGKNGITSNKREGDGKTPTGIYSFGQAFGVAGNPGTSRGWLQVNNNHYWVDDVNSPYYNKLVDASQTGIQWSSAEHLIDPRYPGHHLCEGSGNVLSGPSAHLRQIYGESYLGRHVPRLRV